MSVEVQYQGRLGNQLFEYAFARIVAESFGYELRCTSLEELGDTLLEQKSFAGQKVDEGAHATLHGLASYFKNAPQHLPGRRIDAPAEEWVLGTPAPDGTVWRGQEVDLPRLLGDRRDRRFRFKGYFQRYEYFREHRDKIKEWFALEPLDDTYGITKNDIFLNIRRGYDYAIYGWVLSMSAYKKLLWEVPHERVFVCGTGIDDSLKAALAEFSPIYYQSTPIDEFRFIMQFDKIMQSNSTFCWWAAYLSKATAIYTPRPDRGYLSKEARFADVDLDTGEDRYRYFDARVAEFIPFAPNPQAVLRLDRDGQAWSFIVETASETKRFAVPEEQRKFYEWLRERKTPFGPTELVMSGLLQRSQIEGVVGALTLSGAVTTSQRFREH